MADAPNTAPYILQSADTSDLPNSRILAASGGLQLSDGGAGQPLTIAPLAGSILANLNSFAGGSASGLMTFNTSGDAISAVTLQGTTASSSGGGNSIVITNASGVGGNPTFAVVNDTSIQQVVMQLNGTTQATESTLNFVAGAGITLNVQTDGTNNRANITIGANASQAVSSIGNTSGDTSIAIAGTQGTGPWSGAVTLTVPNWATVDATPSSDIQMQESTFQFCGSLGLTYDGTGDQLTVDSTQSPTAPGLTLKMSNQSGTGVVYDSFYNFPGGNSGTTGQFLRLVSAPSGSTPGTLAWATAAGSGTVTSVTGTSGQISVANSTTTPVISLANSGVTAGSYTNPNLTVDAFGRITTASSGSSGTVTSVGLTSSTSLLTVTGATPITTSGAWALAITPGSNGQVLTTTGGVVAWGSGGGGGTVTAVTGTAPIVSSGGTTPAISLATSGVTAGSYTLSSITVNAQGLITAASSGSAGSGVPYTTSPATNFQVGNATALGSGATNNYIFSTSAFSGLTGSYNTIMGSSGTGVNISTGQWNTLVGNESALNLTTGNSNTVFGQGIESFTGSDNTFIGNSMFLNLSPGAAGSYNIGIGSNLYNDTVTSGPPNYNTNLLIGNYITGLVSGSGSTVNSTSNTYIGNYITATAGLTNTIAILTGSSGTPALGPTVSNSGVIGYNVASGATGDSSFKLGIGKNTPVGTLHLGYAGGSTSEVSIFFDNNPNGTAPTTGQIPPHGMIQYVAGTAGVPTIMSASCGIPGTQIILGYPTNSTDPSRPWVNKGDMLVGSANPAAGTGTGTKVGYFDIVPISNGTAGQVWKNTGSYASWGTVSLPTSEPPIFDNPNPVIPPESTSVIAFADPDDVNDPTDFQLPVDYALGSSFRIVGLNKYGWILSTALGSGVTQKIVYNDQVVTGNNSMLSGISCDPKYGVTPAAEYLGTTVELVYAKLENDGTQVWVVIYTQGVIDMIQG